MHIETSEAISIEMHHELSIEELAELSRLSVGELLELQHSGVIAPTDSTALVPRFCATCLLTTRTACRLRDDLELDMRGIAVAMALIERVRELEIQLRQLHAMKCA
jgi:chaperone modulatory protein CbpM